MKNKFLSFLQKETNLTYTENGATALKTTNSNLLDLFGCIGSLRTRDNTDIERLFSMAFAEDTLLATREINRNFIYVIVNNIILVLHFMNLYIR